jgi:hypothetical protein
VKVLNQEPGSDEEQGAAERLEQKLDEILLAMHKMGIAEYVEMVSHPWRLMRFNFWSGLVRGFGMAIGFTVLAALVVYVLQKIVGLNVPVIGNFIALIVKIVENQLHPGGGTF